MSCTLSCDDDALCGHYHANGREGKLWAKSISNDQAQTSAGAVKQIFLITIMRAAQNRP